MRVARMRTVADLNAWSGTGWLLLYAMAGLGLAIGAMIGWPFGETRRASTSGLLVGLLTWLVVTVVVRHRLNQYQRKHIALK